MIKILDNLTNPTGNFVLYQKILSHEWEYVEHTAYNYTTKPEDYKPYQESWSFTPYIDEKKFSYLKESLEFVLIAGLDKANIDCKKLLRIRVGMHTRTPYPVIHSPHVDWDESHMTALYYVNDADGDTVIYNEKYNPTSEKISYQYHSEADFTIQDTISPKADRMVFFDGLTYHSSSTPTESPHRIVVNFNFLI